MQPIRYGLLSTSSIAPRFVAAVRAAGGGEVVALSSRSLEKAQAKAAEWNIPTAYGSHDQLLGDPNVDVIYLSTVNGSTTNGPKRPCWPESMSCVKSPAPPRPSRRENCSPWPGSGACS